jgi:hypothetical protein
MMVRPRMMSRFPDGDVGDKIEKLFTTEEKDTSEFCHS